MMTLDFEFRLFKEGILNTFGTEEEFLGASVKRVRDLVDRYGGPIGRVNPIVSKSDDGELQIDYIIEIGLPTIITERNLKILFYVIEHEFIHSCILQFPCWGDPIAAQRASTAFDYIPSFREVTKNLIYRPDGRIGYDHNEEVPRTMLDYLL